MATIVTLTAPNGQVLNLTDGSFGYRIGDMGLGLPPMHRIEERGPLQNGVTDLGYRHDPRLVHLALFARGASNKDYLDARLKLMALLRPQNNPLVLSYTVDTNYLYHGYYTMTYLLDCYYAGGLEFDSKDRRGFGQNLAITLRAPQPTWYRAPWISSYIQPLSGWGAQTHLPSDPLYYFEIVNPMGLAYFGSADENPIIKITGPLTGPIRLYSYATKEYLQYNLNLAPGGYVVIDTRYGHKTVVNAAGGNQLSFIEPGSDLATFHLDSSAYNGDPNAYTGNEFRVTAGDAGSGSTAIQIIYNDRFIGF